ncbi:universal stress protein [Amycolatopsis echigonensis]|uniref:Universal stress protein n=1 Tax=Amycolatopsis echigonensis TaxID=2576905 RepID=A0A8E1VYL7_9PSEU|nr:universal stress protein [Amycolatopsis echigonensis]MBB2500586.1 universal stress protein [Amycolatopsis echigonensis]
MSVLAAVTDSEEGDLALARGIAEARLRGTKLLVANLRLSPLEVPGAAEVLERRPGVDIAEHVLDLLDERAGEVELLVIGMKRRSPVGKLVLGSVAQRLLLGAEVPVLAVKTAER